MVFISSELFFFLDLMKSLPDGEFRGCRHADDPLNSTPKEKVR